MTRVSEQPLTNSKHAHLSPYKALGIFYITQTLPMAFLVTALPVLLRQSGVSLELVTLTQLLALPWALKFLWAPFVDRTTLHSIGLRKGWMYAMQAGALISLIGIAVWQDAIYLYVAAFLLACFCATNDIAVDGWAVETLRPDQRPVANAIQMGAVHFAKFLGGGILLGFFIFIGINGLTSFLVIGFLIALWATKNIAEPCVPERTTMPAQGSSTLRTLIDALRRPGTPTWLGSLVLFRSGSVLFMTLLRPYFVDIGWKTQEIALVFGVVLTMGSLIACVFSPFCVRHWGEKKTFVIFGLLGFLSACVFVIQIAIGYSGFGLAVSVVTFAICEAICVVVLFINFMHRSRKSSAGVDFTLQQCIYALTLQIGTVSGFLVMHTHYGLIFTVAAILFVLSLLPLTRRIR